MHALPLSGRRILIAEDESMVALQLEELLHELGCAIVGPVSQVAEFARCIAEENFDGALVDVNLRGQTVFSVLPQLIERGVPFLITSGYDGGSLFPSEYLKIPRLSKPFDEQMLKARCVELFSRPARQMSPAAIRT